MPWAAHSAPPHLDLRLLFSLKEEPGWGGLRAEMSVRLLPGPPPYLSINLSSKARGHAESFLKTLGIGTPLVIQ